MGPPWKPSVDGVNLATPKAPRGPKFSKFRFFVVLRGSGGPGTITNRRGMKKHALDLIFVNFGWIYEGFMPILIFDESLGYAYSSGFKPFSIKAAFWRMRLPMLV